MKKFFIIFVIIFIAINANAQWFIAGSVGLSVSDNKETTDWSSDFKESTSYRFIGFSVAPKAGYCFNEKLAVGLSLSVGVDFKIFNNLTLSNKIQKYAVNWSVFPFVRYSVFTYKKFSIILEGRTGVGASHSFYKPEDENKKNYSNTLAIGVLNVTPILGFKLTDRIQVEAGLHFLNLGYNIDITKEKLLNLNPGTPNKRTTKHYFNIGFNSSSILEVMYLRFGVIYKF